MKPFKDGFSGLQWWLNSSSKKERILFEISIGSKRCAFLSWCYISGEIRYVPFYNQGANQIQKNPENPYELNQIVLTGVWSATGYPVGSLDEKRWAQKGDRIFFGDAAPIKIGSLII